MNARKSLAIDAVALAAYLLAANPALTGIAVHEWLGLGVLVVFLAHCAASADWVARAVRSLPHSSWGVRGNLVLDALILVAFMTVTVSGVCVSGAVLPALGLYADGYYFWDPLHSISAKVLLALLVVHIVVHWRWLASFFGKGKGEEHVKQDGD